MNEKKNERIITMDNDKIKKIIKIIGYYIQYPQEHCYLVKVPTIWARILYGSAFEAGLLSSKYPFQLCSTV